ncbi:MAG: aconitase X catalytic domain-containing protein [Betaproteobacteria bacterium]|nr:aconitase X catalytic domain-containing protein [Betaproteobacteria bacterium]
MEFDPEERSILSGGRGEAARRSLEYQIEVGRFWGAKRFVPVTNVHMMGDIEVMGDGGLEWLRGQAALGARCAVSTTTNARCIDFAHCARLGQDEAEAAKERELIACLRRMDVVTTDTCINYQTVYQPHLGERVAWGDTGTVIYANSVFGARSNFESGPAALAAALTGRTPEYGFHLCEHRRGTFTVRLEAALDDLADWGAVGKLVGEAHQSYFAVPVFHGYRGTPTADELKHLGAALASYGSMAMFHFVGVTPEAPSLESALGGNAPVDEMVIGDEDILRVYRGYALGDGDARLVVFSGPQQSLLEMKRLATLFAGRKIKAVSSCFVTTNSGVLAQARSLGIAQALEDAGVVILEGVCFYILQNLSQMRRANGWTNMVSNSAKIVNIIGAHRFNTILRRTEECVEIACSGVLR